MGFNQGGPPPGAFNQGNFGPGMGNGGPGGNFGGVEGIGRHSGGAVGMQEGGAANNKGGPQVKQENKVSGAPRECSVEEWVSRDPSDVVAILYDEKKFVSKSDGRRFASETELRAHLDLLFEQNKATKEGGGAKERHWFRNREEWTQVPATPPSRALNLDLIFS